MDIKVNNKLEGGGDNPNYAYGYQGYYILMYSTPVGEVWRVKYALDTANIGGSFANKESAKAFINGLGNDTVG